MKMQDIKNKSKADLSVLLSEKRDALKGFRFNVTGSKIKNVKEARNLKKDVARILTALNTK